MDLNIPTLKGGDQLPDIFRRIVEATLAEDITDSYDLDGTLLYAKPGEHVNVPHDPNAEYIILQRNRQTNGNSPPITGRPHIFVKNAMPNARVLIGTEHGSVWHFPDGQLINRIGDPQTIKEILACFDETRQASDLLRDVQIEDHKTVSGTIGFTHIINPHNLTEIDTEALQRMKEIRLSVVGQLQSTIDKLGIRDLQVVPTVTPTNAVVELLFEGACKAESIRHAREQGWLKNASTNVFCGDSNGDKSVMEMIASETGGICLGVGPKAPTCSHVVFAGPEHLRAFWGRVIETVDERQQALPSLVKEPAASKMQAQIPNPPSQK